MIYRILRQLVRKLELREQYARRGEYILEGMDNRRDTNVLVIILAGYKEFLWPYTLPRFEACLPDDADVCVVSSGVYSEKLSQLAHRNGWSYLSLKKNLISTAQNTAIGLFEAADWIYKFDEDIFVSPGITSALMQGYLRIEEEGRYVPGLVGPMININGFSYLDFLSLCGSLDDYRRKFGEYVSRGGSHHIQADVDAAKWVWQKSLPFEKVAQRVAAQDFSYKPVPHRYSIGAILFKRQLWLDMGGFKQVVGKPGLGEDEKHVCEFCMNSSRTINVINNVFCGHFAFAPQEEGMKNWLDEVAHSFSYAG